MTLANLTALALAAGAILLLFSALALVADLLDWAAFDRSRRRERLAQRRVHDHLEQQGLLQ